MHIETNERIHAAVVSAQEAFWAKIAGAFPEISTGDFSPSAQVSFDAACMSAAVTWVQGNQSDPISALSMPSNSDLIGNRNSEEPRQWLS